jgi:hypothetical protein
MDPIVLADASRIDDVPEVILAEGENEVGNVHQGA